MAAAFYSTATAVRTRSGVGPEDLGLDDEVELTAFIEELLLEITDLMDRRMKKSYLTGDVPAGLAGIAADVAADSVRDMVVSRQTPIVRVDDFAIRTISSRLLSADMVARLRMYGASVGSIDVGLADLSPSGAGGFIVDGMIVEES
jgi:hypothetical protein